MPEVLFSLKAVGFLRSLHWLLTFTHVFSRSLTQQNVTQVPRGSRAICGELPHLQDNLVERYTPCGAEFSPPPSTKCQGFLMLFMGHCGSSAFMEKLGEIYDIWIPGFEPLFKYHKAQNTSAALQDEELMFERGRVEHMHVGYKMRPWSVRKEPSGFVA